MTSRPNSATDRLSSENRIDAICDAFEEEYQRGNLPSLDSYLDHCEASERTTLFVELLLLDLEYRKQRGETLSRDDYLRRFPNFADQIEAIQLTRGLEDTSTPATERTLCDSPKVGHRIAHFELQEKLGSGVAGEVWKANDSRLQRTVAIKISRHRHRSEEERHRFLREARTAAQLSHPRIVSVHEAGRDADTTFIVSDLIVGQDLRQRLREHRLSLREAAGMCAELAEALHHAHEQGVIHRDLKPANVLLDEQQRPYITDFGLAKWADDTREMTLDGQLIGTPAYMSPEQARGEAARVDRRTDVYALGAMLYEMLTGEYPFQGDQASMIHAIINKDPQPPRSLDRRVPRDLETICLKAVEKNPRHRYVSAQEMALDLRRFLSGESILARRAGPIEKSWRSIRRRPAIATSIFLVFVALGLAGVIWTRAGERHDLLGLQTVTLTTIPPGAKVTFVPLGEKNGEPIVDQIVHARGRSPVREKLKPGSYLVVAVLDDGRFHEVYRHVPRKGDIPTAPGKHYRWKFTANGDTQLPKIEIPSGDVTTGMAYLEGSGNFLTVLGKDSPFAKSYTIRMPSYYIDTHEFTVSDYQRLLPQWPPSDIRWVPRPEDWAATVSFDLAVYLAEKTGKRLPTDAEYEFAATNRGRSKYPWGDSSPEPWAPTDFGPVRSPKFDRLSTTPAVFGLCSNVAEWTMSITPVLFPDAPAADVLSDGRLVRGGNLQVVDGDPSINSDNRNPRSRVAVSRPAFKPGLGFRCVRSARPRTQPKDFESMSRLFTQKRQSKPTGGAH